MGRLMLWTIPRSKSTIILKALSGNPELKCIFEPFTYAYFAENYQTDYDINTLRELFKSEPFTSDNIVIKDIPRHVKDLDFESWFLNENFKHALLVRHPQEVALSKIKVNGDRKYFMKSRELLNADDLTIEAHFEAMLKLKEFLEVSGIQFKVFDVTDLYSDNCEQFLKSLCEFGEIAYSNQMLKMKKCESFPKNWWVAPETTSAAIDDSCFEMNFEFHENSLKATEFQKRAEKRDEVTYMSKHDRINLNKILSWTLHIYAKLLEKNTDS